ncbi:helix-turn-helix transcriptional regulator [Lactobacillus salivarius]|nr:helix-turn-helix transcriptional regulator [Ligilactobacillus salivarius]
MLIYYAYSLHVRIKIVNTFIRNFYQFYLHALKNRRCREMIVNNLSTIMGKKRIKIATLYKRTGISRSTLTHLYYDKTTMIKLDTIDKLCSALDITPGELFEYRKE